MSEETNALDAWWKNVPGVIDPLSYPMGTTTGAFFPFDPQPYDVFPDDIARSLSRTPRYLGHTERRYTVMEHSLLMLKMMRCRNSRWCQKGWARVHGGFSLEEQYNMRLAVLLHDAAEAYSHDLIVPLKRGLGDVLQRVENPILAAIYKRFGVPFETIPPYVRFLDYEALLLERASPYLFPLRGMPFRRGDGTEIPNPWKDIDETIDAKPEIFREMSLEWIPRVEPTEDELISGFESALSEY